MKVAALYAAAPCSGKRAAESTELDEGHRTPLSLSSHTTVGPSLPPLPAAAKHSAPAERPPSRITHGGAAAGY